MLSIGTLVNGKYEITGLIGKGGMSTVYRGIDRVNGYDLAIKVADRRALGDDRTSELSLATEGSLLKQLSHPLLTKIYDVIETSDYFMIVMEYVEGLSLDKVLEQFGAMEQGRVIKLSIQICAVLQYLHTQNPPVIYRDMKPSNVILQPDGSIKLIDFGTARTYKNSDRTSDTILFGTEGFAAPEQFGGLGQSDNRTDIFCLGATMFNLVTNHSPYKKPFGVTPLENWNPAFKGCDLDRIIQKCVERDPNMRYQSAWDLREDLIKAYDKLGSKGRILGRLGRSADKAPRGNDNQWKKPEMKPSDGRSHRFIREYRDAQRAKREQSYVNSAGNINAAPGDPMQAYDQNGTQYQNAQFDTMQNYASQQASMQNYASQQASMQNYASQQASMQDYASQQENYAYRQAADRQYFYDNGNYVPEQKGKSIWMIFMLVGLIAGAALLILGLIMRTGSSSMSFVSIIIGCVLLGFGIVSFVMYLREQRQN